MSSPPETLTNWQGGVLVAHLGDGIPVAKEPLLCSPSSFSKVLCEYVKVYRTAIQRATPDLEIIQALLGA